MAGHTGALGKGVYLAFSDDGTSFEAPSWIQSSDVSGKDHREHVPWSRGTR